MKKAIFVVTILFIAVISTACINNIAVQELNNKAKMYMEKGDYNSAIERLESSLELDGTIYETYYNLGVAYTSAKRYEKSIEFFKKAISINSKYADTYYSLAVAQEAYANSFDENCSDDDMEESPRKNTYSNEIKEKMIEYYLGSINNYKKYSDMVNSPQKTKEINYHIAEMEKTLSKLGYSGSIE